jgi:hypothetical protein
MGYGAFLKTFTNGVNPLIDELRADVTALATVSAKLLNA